MHWICLISLEKVNAHLLTSNCTGHVRPLKTKMVLLIHNCGGFLLYFLIATVSCTSKKILKSVDNVEHQETGVSNKKPCSHELDDKCDSLPDSETDVSTTTSKLTGFTGIPDANQPSAFTTNAGSTIITDFLSTANFTTSSVLSTSYSTPNASAPTTAPTYHPITAPPGNRSCQHLLELYANLSSTFTSCAIIHAKPFLFCENCVKQYVATLDAYEKITEDEVRTDLHTKLYAQTTCLSMQ